MKRILAIAVMIFGTSLGAVCWNCTTPGQVRVQVPTGTVGSGTGDGSGQVVVDSGLTFICEVLPTATTVPPSSTSSATSGSTSGATSTATGGNATATNTNKNTLTNNNTVSNTLSQTQKQQQQQSQTQSNASTNSNQSAGGSVSDVGNSETTVEAPKIPVASAYAPPVFSTANCFKGWSAGGQTPLIGGSFGGGGIDKNCAALSTSQNLFAMGSRLAACKVIITTKAAKDAGVTINDCMYTDNVGTIHASVIQPVVQPVQVTVNVPPAPAAQLIYLTPPQVAPVVAPKPLGDVKPKSVKHISKPCKVASLQQPMEK